MNEGRTSAIFAAVAAVSLGLAFWSRPDSITDESDLIGEVTGQPVFAKFEDPGEAASFQIVKYDDALGQLDRFEVAKDKATNMWKLPSFEDYPADAAEQVRDATTPLISMPILSVASLDRGDHAYYGVVNPDEENLTVGESGIGMLVRVKDATNQVLADLVIGKEVEGVEKQRYVRVPSEDATYVVELDTAPFTTDFQKWINQELLEVRSFDISTVGLRDYAILPTNEGYGMSRNFDADLSFDAASNTWSLKSLTDFKSGKGVPGALAEGEKLQDSVLNDLRNAIQDLEIVNVRRKPKGLAADLKADKSLMENKESLQSLLSQGFIPQEGPNGTEIFATGGETLVGTQAGVKYLLRFGEAVANLTSAADGEESGLRRYLLVSAVLDESMFPPPDLEPLPETVEEMLAMQNKAKELAEGAAPTDSATPATEAPAPDESNATQPTADQPTGDKPTEEESAKEKPAEVGSTAPAESAPSPDAGSNQPPAEPTTEKPAAEKPVAEEPTAEQPAGADEDSCGPQETTQQETSSAASVDESASGQAAAKVEEPAASAAQPPASDTAVENPPSPDKPSQEAKPADEDKSAEEPKKSEEELKEELEFVRERIAKENQRKIDERKEKIDAARKRVQELNARFADWYYVVSDSVYKKLKVSREQLIVSADAGATTTEPPRPSFELGN